MDKRDSFTRRAVLTAALVLCSGCESVDTLFCGTSNCQFSRAEWNALRSLANLGNPPEDSSNQYVGQPAAEHLGQQFYFDSRFSGPATQLDMLRRPTPYARAPKGQPSGVSCATCHLPAHAGADPNSVPGNVSVGAGFYDVNSQPTLNAAYYDLLYWNGRVDSLWAQAVAVTESFVSMNGNRLHVAWVIADHYRSAYESVFANHPLPMRSLNSTAQGALLDDSGHCRLDAQGGCPADDCHLASPAGGPAVCLPRFPLEGRPGSTAGCQLNSSQEPFGDAYDCMLDADKAAVTRVLVNFAKAISAYEYTLLSRNSAFDEFVAEGPESTKLSTSAQRGARLFVGKAGCIECHSTPLFSNNQFENIGVPQVGPGVPTEADCPEGSPCDCIQGVNCLPWGALDGLKKLKGNGFRRDSMWSDNPSDGTRADWVAQNLEPSFKGAWRTPSLRDVARTAPYMHNGLYQTLEEVISHYNLGGTAAGFSGTPSPKLQPLGLSELEQRDLVSFLESLNGAPLEASLVQAPQLP